MITNIEMVLRHTKLDKMTPRQIAEKFWHDGRSSAFADVNALMEAHFPDVPATDGKVH